MSFRVLQKYFVHHSHEDNSLRGVLEKCCPSFFCALPNPLIDFEHYPVRFATMKHVESASVLLADACVARDAHATLCLI